MTPHTIEREDSSPGAGEATVVERCDLCGDRIHLDPDESRFEATVAHFETVHAAHD
jgi:hypothetical protein